MPMPILSSGFDFVMGLGILQLHAKFAVASSNRCRNIEGEPQNLGSSLAQGHAHFFFLVGFCDGLRQTHLHTKFEVASFSQLSPIHSMGREMSSNLVSLVYGDGGVLFIDR